MCENTLQKYRCLFLILKQKQKNFIFCLHLKYIVTLIKKNKNNAKCYPLKVYLALLHLYSILR